MLIQRMQTGANPNNGATNVPNSSSTPPGSDSRQAAIAHAQKTGMRAYKSAVNIVSTLQRSLKDSDLAKPETLAKIDKLKGHYDRHIAALKNAHELHAKATGSNVAFDTGEAHRAVREDAVRQNREKFPGQPTLTVH